MFFFFFFKQKTAYEIKECDWSSDVCSSDLQVINRIVWERIAVVGVVSAAGTLLLLDAYLPGGLLTIFGGKDIAYARTMAFVTLAIFQMFDAFNCRQLTHSVLKHMFGNRWLNAAVAVSMAMMVDRKSVV